MPSKPSRADQELADQATAAGVPTSGDQVRELHERRVLPEKHIPTRGRGVTTSAYPPGALDVLIEVRRAMTTKGFGRLHLAVCLAWIRGANVRSEALHEGLLAYIDGAVLEINRKTRRHRSSYEEGRFSSLVDRQDRRAFLSGIAGIMNGKSFDRGPAMAFGHIMDEVMRGLPELSRALPTPSTGASPTSIAPLPPRRSAVIAQQLSHDALPGEAVVDLTAVAMRANVDAMLPARRRELDEIRDRIRAAFGKAGLYGNDETALIGMVLAAAGFGVMPPPATT